MEVERMIHVIHGSQRGPFLSSPGERDWLAIVTCCYKQIFRSPRERDVRKSSRLDGEDCRDSWVGDYDGQVVTLGIAQWESLSGRGR